MYQKNISMVLLALFYCGEAFNNEVISVKGRNGKDGSKEHGHSTFSRSHCSSNGDDGNHASNSTPGEDGGTIELSLTDISNGKSKRVDVQVKGIIRSQRDAPESISQTISFARSSQKLFLNAGGGDGGDGGHGGNGEGGCQGSTGTAATQYSRGRAGGTGYRGGDGGNGTAGSNSGRGGKVNISMAEADLHLALLVDYNISAGQAGGPGRHGSGGDGGAGGRGGDSYSWSEQVSDGVNKGACSVSKDANGVSGTVSCAPDTPRYKTIHHSQPGGRSGLSGTSGNSGIGDLSSGRRSAHGKFSYSVRFSSGQIEKYKNAYRVVIESFTLIDHNKDGIFEPNEMVYITKIKVKNTGEMPTPHAKAKIFLALAGTDITGIDGALILPSLKGGQSHLFKKALSFKIPPLNNLIGKQKRAEKDSTLNLKAVQDKLNIPFKETSRSFNITYPIEITALTMPKTISAGEIKSIILQVKNISGRDFGLKSEAERLLKTSLHLKGPESLKHHFTLINKNNKSQNLLFAIQDLKAGQAALIEVKIQAKKSVPSYSSIALGHQLQLEKLAATGHQLSTVQKNLYELRASAVYKHNPRAKILLVANRKTKKKEFDAWMEVFKSLKLQATVWDLDFNGHLSLTKKLASGDGSLIEHYKNKTIIILNNNTDKNSNAAKIHLANKNFLLAAKKYHINFFIYGGDRKHLLELRDSLLNDQSQFIEKINYKTMFYESDQEAYQKAANSLLLQLKENRPKKSFFIKRNNLNKNELNFRESLSFTSGQVYLLPYTDPDIHRALRVKSPATLKALILSLPFSEKLNLLKLNQHSHLAKISLTHDLIREIDFNENLFLTDRPFTLKRFNQFIKFANNKLHPQEMIKSLAYPMAAITFYLEVISKYFHNGDFIDMYTGPIEEILAKNPLLKALMKKELKPLKAKLERRMGLISSRSNRYHTRNILVLPAIHRVLGSESALQDNFIEED